MTFIDLEYGMDENWQNLSLKPSEHENTNDINFRFGKNSPQQNLCVCMREGDI